MFLIDSLILGTGVLLLLGIASSKLSNRLGVPVLVLFLVLGMLAGSDGIGGIEFENYRLAHGIGSLALADPSPDRSRCTSSQPTISRVPDDNGAASKGPALDDDDGHAQPLAVEALL
jgi:hypothetical protein